VAGQGALGVLAGMSQSAPGKYGFSSAAVDAVLGVGGEGLGNALEKMNRSAVKGYISKTITGLQNGSIKLAGQRSPGQLVNELQRVLSNQRNLEGFMSGMATGLAGSKATEDRN
jgi:hypothetical protein